MPSTDEIVVRFKTEGGDTVEEAFRRVGSASDTFHQKVGKAGGALNDLRLKSEGRVANNIGAIAQSLSSGANAGELFAVAVTKASESFRGSLLFAGAATAGLGLYNYITKTGEAAIQLGSELANLHRASLPTGDFLGADEVSKNLDAATGKLDTLVGKFRGEHSGLSGLVQRALRLGPEFLVRGGVHSLGSLDKADLDQINQLRKDGLAILEQSTTKQRTLNDITREGLTGDERKAALAKLKADHDERAAKIAGLEARLGVTGVSKAQQAEQTRYNLAVAAAKNQSDLQGKALQHAEDLIEIEKSGLTVQSQKFALLGEEVRYRERLVALANKSGTFEEKAAAGVALDSAQAALRNAQFSAYQSGYSPGAFAFEKRINDQQRADFNYFRGKFREDEQNRTLYPDLDRRSSDLREYQRTIFGDGGGQGLFQQIGTLIETLQALPAKVGVT